MNFDKFGVHAVVHNIHIYTQWCTIMYIVSAKKWYKMGGEMEKSMFAWAIFWINILTRLTS